MNTIIEHIKNKNRVKSVVVCLLMCLLPFCVMAKGPKKKKGGLGTSSLYMQYEHPQISVLTDANGQKPNFLSEKLSYTHADNELTTKDSTDKKPKSINEVQNLNEVVITTKSKFAPEYKGKIEVDFQIRVPKVFFSPNWRIILSPKLMHNDSTIDLQKVVLKGHEFAQMQKDSYTRYDQYIKSIVGKDRYDSVFVDYKSLGKDINNVQGMFYQHYQSNWGKQKEYLDNLAMWKKKQDFFEQQQREYKAKVYLSYSRKAYYEKVKNELDGKDTTGIYAKYMKMYKKDIKRMSEYFADRKRENEKSKPRPAFDTNRLSDMSARIFNEKDSAEIAHNSYRYGDIANNEMKMTQKDQVFKDYVVFPYETNTRMDSVMDGGSDFVFIYKQSYDVVPDLKKIRIYMDTRVEVTDQSSYISPAADTLSYFVASLAQLADSTLAYKVSNLTRNGMNTFNLNLKYLPKNHQFNPEYGNNKTQMGQMNEFFEALKQGSIYAVDSIEVNVSHSLLGEYESNMVGSQKEAENLVAYLQKKYPQAEVVKWMAKGTGEDWSGLVREIKRNDQIQNKEEILDTLSKAKFPDVTEAVIKKKFASDYAVIYKSIYPTLDNSSIGFYLHRTDMTQNTEVRKDYKGSNYEQGVRLLMEREYRKALVLLADYPDYNTALCLACLGYNAKAYELLVKLQKDGNRDYLLAIVASRLGKKDEAIAFMKDAFKEDPSKKYRVRLDYEAQELVENNNL